MGLYLSVYKIQNQSKKMPKCLELIDSLNTYLNSNEVVGTVEMKSWKLNSCEMLTQARYILFTHFDSKPRKKNTINSSKTRRGWRNIHHIVNNYNLGIEKSPYVLLWMKNKLLVNDLLYNPNFKRFDN